MSHRARTHLLVTVTVTVTVAALALAPTSCMPDQIMVETLPHDPVCGDGTLEGSEECDDGNTTDGDGCSSDCQIETTVEICNNGVDDDSDGLVDCADPDCSGNPACSLTCGNGIVDQGEECDGGDLDGQTCATLGYTGGTLSCDGTCYLDLSGCVGGVCGNGIVEAGEQCDDGNVTWCDGCSPACEIQPTVETDCADGIDEDCDGLTDCADPDCAGSPGCP